MTASGVNPLLAQFLAEARDYLEQIGTTLMELEHAPEDAELMTVLFRMVHTLKGNSGLFDFHEMTRVLHAGEDLMDAVRHGDAQYSRDLADRLLDAMDFVGLLCDEIERDGTIGARHAATSAQIAQSLRQLRVTGGDGEGTKTTDEAGELQRLPGTQPRVIGFDALPETAQAAVASVRDGGVALFWIEYTPVEECFFQGDDPLHIAMGIPDCLWGAIESADPWPELHAMDAYRCVLRFNAVSSAPRDRLDEHFRYIVDQVRIVEVTDAVNDEPTPLFVDATGRLATIIEAQRLILSMPAGDAWHSGRLNAVVSTLRRLARAHCSTALLERFEQIVASNDMMTRVDALAGWIDTSFSGLTPKPVGIAVAAELAARRGPSGVPETVRSAADAETDSRTSRRTDETSGSPKSLKVEPAKIDRLMSLIGEIVVAKNALPYLAGRAEVEYGSREMGREIRAQYAVINRIAEEMQDAIMQVRMMPVSFVFQRFPRLVRDISRQLGKDVQLVVEGEDTEADKTVIESISDPLIHILRNSLDHGLELPDVRRAAGKPATGTLTLRARQESDRVVIEVTDDGKGIDPLVVKRKALERGLIDEPTFERLSDTDAINLIFAPGFSTMEVVSDLSGRGVGMDVVRTAIAKVNGSVELTSTLGVGTRLALTLPLSMAITKVMIVESDGQRFGVPMESVVETVRVASSAIRTIKTQPATVLRGRLVPLRSVNSLLALSAPPSVNAYDEVAVLVARAGTEMVGLLVDDFRETVDVILKPMTGVLAGLSSYAGSALMGDGSVLMVLNLREIL